MTRIVKRPEIRRAEIIAAARRLFLENEYEKTTVQDIVESLGIAKGTVYHYFKDKEELLEVVVEDLAQEEYQKKRTFLDSIGGTALEKMEQLTGWEPVSGRLLEALHKPGNGEMHAKLLGLSVMKEATLYGGVVEQGCYEGIFQTKHPRECAEFFISAVQFLTDVGIYPWTQEDLVRRIQAFPSMIESLLNAPEGSFQFLAGRLSRA